MAAARSKIDYVYFIQSEATRAIKIGTSARPDARLSDLQVANSDKLTLLGTTTAHSERALHAKFASIRIHGEWFKPEPALISFLREIGLDPRSAVSLKSRSTRLHLEIRK